MNTATTTTLNVSEDDALDRINGEIVGENIIYFAEETDKWYKTDRSSISDLRTLMESPEMGFGEAYSRWCAGDLDSTEHITEDEARAAASE